MLGMTEIIIIVGVILLFFGAKRLPELGRAIGLSAKEFKKGIKDEEIDVTESSRMAKIKRETDQKHNS